MSPPLVLQLVLAGGLLLCYAVAAVAEAYAWSALKGLPREVRERVRERVARWTLALRVLDSAGILALLLALARFVGMLKQTVPQSWAPRALACGVALLCLERILRTWIMHRAFTGEPEARSTHRRARAVAVTVTLAQAGLAGIMYWWAFEYLPQVRPAAPLESTPPADEERDEDGTSPLKRDWVDEGEAAEILGRDADYVALLALHDGVLVKHGQTGTAYDRVWLELRKQSDLPTREALEAAVKKEPPPAPSFTSVIGAALPLLEEGKMAEATQRTQELTGWPRPRAASFAEALDRAAQLARQGKREEAVQRLAELEGVDREEARLAVMLILYRQSLKPASGDGPGVK